MTTHIPPVPSGYVRQRRAAASIARSRGAFRPLAEAIVRAFDAVAGFVRRVSRLAAQRRERARMVGELSALSNHTLKDIGIERSGIRSAVLDIERGVDPRAR